MQVNNYTIYYTWIFLGYEKKTSTCCCIRFISSGCFWLIGGWRGNCWLNNPGRWLHRPWAHDGSAETVDLLMIFFSLSKAYYGYRFWSDRFPRLYGIRSKTHCFFLLGGGVFKAHDLRTLPCIWRFFVFFCHFLFLRRWRWRFKTLRIVMFQRGSGWSIQLHFAFGGVSWYNNKRLGQWWASMTRRKGKCLTYRGYGTVPRSFFGKLVCLSHKLDVTPGTLQRGISHRWRDWVIPPANWARIASGYSVDFGDLPCGKEGYLPPLPRMLKKVGRCEDYIDGGCLGMAFNCDWPQKNSGELLFFFQEWTLKPIKLFGDLENRP